MTKTVSRRSFMVAGAGVAGAAGLSLPLAAQAQATAYFPQVGGCICAQFSSGIGAS